MNSLLLKKHKREGITVGKQWKPECLENKSFAGTAEGYLVPCCWCDRSMYQKEKENYTDELLESLYDEELALQNNESINDIIASEQWIKFYDAIKAGPDHASVRCKLFCHKPMYF